MTNINSLNHRIILYNKNNKNKIFIKTKLPPIKSNILEYQLNNFYTDENKIKLENRVILSNKIINVGNIFNVTLINKINLYHNIKFINLNNDFTKPRIIFKKYNKAYNYLTNNEIYESNNYTLNQANNNFYKRDFYNNDVSNLPFENITINIYKNYENTKYYKIKFIDFIDLSNKGLLAEDITSKINNIHLDNEYDTNIVNYDENLFKNLYKYDNINDISLLKINENLNYNIDNSGIFIYNNFNNITTIDISYIDNTNTSDPSFIYQHDLSINFFILNRFNYNNNNFGKIILNKDFTYINGRVTNNKSTNINNIIDNYSNNNKIFLSLGNGILGLRQKDLINNYNIDVTNKKIFITENNRNNSNNSNNSNTSNTSNTSNNMLNNNYLIDGSYNYNYTNLYINQIFADNIKKGSFDLSNIFSYYLNNNDISNIFNESLNSLKFIDNSFTSYDYKKIQYFLLDIINNDSAAIRFIKDFNNNSSYTINNNVNTNYNLIESNNIIKYDFRFNYGKTFDINNNINLSYNDNSLNITSYILNFNKINIVSNFTTTQASDFTNVDCIFVYHDPITDPSAEFRFPNNNIEIVRSSDIDTFQKAITLLPGARTSTTNSVFIPAKNGSNLSRKMIQGLVGLNNVPKLLSIKPYDDSILEGRGFINQFRINDTCETNIDKVKKKLNSQKHISVKNSRIFNSNSKDKTRLQQYASVVRSNARNRNISLISECLENTVTPEKISEKPIITPFRFFKTGRGNYIRSGR